MQTENKHRLLLLGKVILAIITFFVVKLLCLIVIGLIPSNAISTPLLFVVFGGLDILNGLIILALFVKVIDREKTITSNWFSPRVRDFFTGGFLGSICVILGFLIIINVHWNLVVIESLRLNYLLGSFFMALCGTFLEELVFRGYVLRKLLEKFSTVMSLSLSSLMFCLLHFFNADVTILSITNIFLAGMLLGVLFLKTKNIWLVVGLHLFWNYVQSILGFNVSGIGLPSILNLNFESMNLFNGGNFGLEGSYICSIILLLAICFYYKKPRRDVGKKYDLKK